MSELYRKSPTILTDYNILKISSAKKYRVTNFRLLFYQVIFSFSIEMNAEFYFYFQEMVSRIKDSVRKKM